MKRRTQALEQALAVGKQGPKAAPAGDDDGSSPDGAIASARRGSPRSGAGWAFRRAIAACCSGVSAQTIYNWEDGNGRPRARNMPAIAALRTMGRKESYARLEALKGEG